MEDVGPASRLSANRVSAAAHILSAFISSGPIPERASFGMIGDCYLESPSMSSSHGHLQNVHKASRGNIHGYLGSASVHQLRGALWGVLMKT